MIGQVVHQKSGRAVQHREPLGLSHSGSQWQNAIIFPRPVDEHILLGQSLLFESHLFEDPNGGDVMGHGARFNAVQFQCPKRIVQYQPNRRCRESTTVVGMVEGVPQPTRLQRTADDFRQGDRSYQLIGIPQKHTLKIRLVTLLTFYTQSNRPLLVVPCVKLVLSCDFSHRSPIVWRNRFFRRTLDLMHGADSAPNAHD